MRTQNNVKRNLCKKNSEESLPKKSNNFSIIFFFVKRLYQGNSEGTFSVQKYEEKSLPKNLSRDSSLPKNLKKNLYEK